MYGKTVIFIFVFFVSQSANAGDNWVFKTGFNIAQIRNAESTPQLGASIGIEREFHIVSFFSISPEIFFSYQTCYTHSSIAVDNRDLYDKTIIHVKNMDLSIIFDFLIYTGKINLTLRAFPSYNVSEYGYTEYYFSGVGNKRISPNNHGISLNLAITALYKRFSLEIRYMNNTEILDKNDQYYEYVQNNYLIHSVHLLFGFHF